ncbi:hypothetical protein INR49_029154 [Caranx melampygus]|nr:hypothetical protein INR49_029154 [Caranx melampygus]
MLTPVVEYDADASTGGGTGIRRHSVSEITSCVEESTSVVESTPNVTSNTSTSSLTNHSPASTESAALSDTVISNQSPHPELQAAEQVPTIFSQHHSPASSLSPPQVRTHRCGDSPSSARVLAQDMSSGPSPSSSPEIDGPRPGVFGLRAGAGRHLSGLLTALFRRLDPQQRQQQTECGLTIHPDYDESGGSDNEDYPLFRELWRYHFATGCWQQIRTEGYMPTELASMSAVLHGNNLLVFGGTGIPFGENNGNDVHVCNVKYKRWSLLNCRGKKPNRIYGQAMVIINGFLYVFGGTTGYIYSTDLHRLDLTTREWIHLKPNNPPDDLPEERYRHEIAHDGRGSTFWEGELPGHLILWTRVSCSQRCHSCVQIKNDVFICGGYNGELILADLWKINLQTFQWSKLPAVMPEPAYFHCAAVTPAGCMYIHGGVVNIHENKRTGSLFKIWLAVPSLLELCWEKLLQAFPHLTSLPTMQLLNLGLTQELIERLK